MLGLRRTAVLAAGLGATVLGVPAALGHDSLYDKKHQLDSRIASVRDQIEAAKNKEGVLTSEIEAADSDIDSLESQIETLSGRLTGLEADLARHRDRLAALQERYREQTRTLERLVREHAAAQLRLEDRLVELYEADQVDALGILLQVESLNDLIEQVDYMNQIGLEDRRMVAELDRLEGDLRVARRETEKTKKEVAAAIAVLAEKTEEVRAAQAELFAEQSALEAAQNERLGLLADVRGERHEAEEDLVAMAAASSRLAAQIQATQSSSSAGGGSSGGSSSDSGDSTPSSSGFIWPVSGPVTSGFGWRWGRMHEGIDIGASYGAPVRAAGSGTIIYAGGMSGYGNIVVIDHGGGIATAYAHLSSIWIGGGSVSQGQPIGAVGCTGQCTGNHLHFEVRVNGSPVNPLGHL
jgi:murein DD-endopeptidase MepM/ murein hydrolase activator NlpD